MLEGRVSNHEVIPLIESTLFYGHEDAQFAVGIVAFGNSVVPNLESEHYGYRLLRGNVYARQMNFMPVDDLKSDGTETDVDDSRSVHFAVIENVAGMTRVVGAMRIIIKDPQNNGLLPIEEHYPNAFKDGSAPSLSTEVSRLICRHENAWEQRNMRWLLFSAGVAYVRDNQLGPVYGAVEEKFERSLSRLGVPVTALGKSMYVPDFNATKLPIRVDIVGLTQRINGELPQLLHSMEIVSRGFVYTGNN